MNDLGAGEDNSGEVDDPVLDGVNAFVAALQSFGEARRSFNEGLGMIQEQVPAVNLEDLISLQHYVGSFYQWWGQILARMPVAPPGSQPLAQLFSNQVQALTAVAVVINRCCFGIHYCLESLKESNLHGQSLAKIQLGLAHLHTALSKLQMTINYYSPLPGTLHPAVIPDNSEILGSGDVIQAEGKDVGPSNLDNTDLSTLHDERYCRIFKSWVLPFDVILSGLM